MHYYTIKMSQDKIEKDVILRDIYYSAKTGYKSPDHLYNLVKEEYPSIEISKYFIKSWLLQQASYTRFKKWSNPKHYRHTLVRDFDRMQMDLIFMRKEYLEENDGYGIILNAIEILSRYAFSIPLKSKKGSEVKIAIEKVLEEFEKRFGKEVKSIQFDEGSEFLNREVESLFKSRDIVYFSTASPRKASVVERFNQTLKNKTMKMFEKNENHIWVDFLDDLVYNYNHTKHRSIGMKPAEVNEENKFTVWGRLFGHLVEIKKPKYKEGDEVRVLKLNIQYRRAQLKPTEEYRKKEKDRDPSKRTFGDYMRKKYKEKDEEKIMGAHQHAVAVKRPPFSKEIFRIEKVLLGDPNVYKLYSDEADVELAGIYYEEELSLIKR